MNNTRKTVNTWVQAALSKSLSGFMFVTGDENEATIKPPTVGIKWLDGGLPGHRPESRIRLAQFEVYVGSSANGNPQTSLAEDATAAVLDALSLRVGSIPKGLIPKLDFTAGAPGVPLGTTIMFTLQAGRGWVTLEPPQQKARLYVLTVEVDYEPG